MITFYRIVNTAPHEFRVEEAPINSQDGFWMPCTFRGKEGEKLSAVFPRMDLAEGFVQGRITSARERRALQRAAETKVNTLEKTRYFDDGDI